LFSPSPSGERALKGQDTLATLEPVSEIAARAKATWARLIQSMKPIRSNVRSAEA